jgi:hypothetical protein
MHNLKIAAFAAAALLGLSMMIGTAAAMPLNGLPQPSSRAAGEAAQGQWPRQPPRWRGNPLAQMPW